MSDTMRTLGRIPLLLVTVAALAATAGCREDAPPSAPVVLPAPTAPRAEVARAEPPASAPSSCCETGKVASPDDPRIEVAESGVTLPDVTLTDQDDRPVDVAGDLGRDRLLVMNFIFTTCKGICPPMGVNFGELQRRLGDRLGRDVSLVSVSVDPTTDTPERLRAWGRQFGAGPGWSLLTGPKRDVDRLLKGLGAFAPDKTEHTPFVLIGSLSEGRWQRVHGLTPPETLLRIIVDRLGPSSADSSAGKGPAEVPASQRYFTDLPLVDQDGRKVRLYTDLIKGKVVVITPFFTTCKGSCPHLIETFSKLQAYYGERVGKDLFLISITVDPDTDGPEALKAYAGRVKALPGWTFVTGDRKNLAAALTKLGHKAEVKEDHANLFIIGNEPTGLWKKAMGLAPAGEVIKIVDSVLDDKPS